MDKINNSVISAVLYLLKKHKIDIDEAETEIITQYKHLREEEKEKFINFLKECREDLADLEHQRWSRWQKYLHSKCKKLRNKDLVIPNALVERWTRQTNTDYKDLTRKEKDSDRKEADQTISKILEKYEKENIKKT